MAIQIQLYGAQHVQAAIELNRRLSTGGVHSGFLLPENAAATPADRSRPVFKEQYVVQDAAGVHGGFMLQSQQFRVMDEERQIGNYQMPISEGLINRAYGTVGIAMLRHALKMHPHLFCLGMGSADKPLPRMLAAMGWRLTHIPFLFRVHRAASFLRHIAPLRSSPFRARLLDAAAATGLGSLGFRVLQTRLPLNRRMEAVPCESFGAWADVVWEGAKSNLSFSAVRSSEVLNILYPSQLARFHRLRIGTSGWAVVLDTQMNSHRYFGGMRVGTIVDALAVPGKEVSVAGAASQFLAARGVDLIVTNQAHAGWVAAFRRCGFLNGPSNYILGTSKKLTEDLQPWDTHASKLHITRGDGDGPLDL